MAARKRKAKKDGADPLDKGDLELPNAGQLKRFAKRRDAIRAAVQAYCTAALTEEAAGAVNGVRWIQGEATVQCGSAALVQELSQFHAAALLAHVRETVPQVARIRVVLG